MIGNNCQDWVEWLLCEIDPELARAMYERGVRKVSETFLGHVAKRNKSWTDGLPSSLGSSASKGFAMSKVHTYLINYLLTYQDFQSGSTWVCNKVGNFLTNLKLLPFSFSLQIFWQLKISNSEYVLDKNMETYLSEENNQAFLKRNLEKIELIFKGFYKYIIYD